MNAEFYAVEEDEVYRQPCRTAREVNKIVVYFDELTDAAERFRGALSSAEQAYRSHLEELQKSDKNESNTVNTMAVDQNIDSANETRRFVK